MCVFSAFGKTYDLLFSTLVLSSWQVPRPDDIVSVFEALPSAAVVDLASDGAGDDLRGRHRSDDDDHAAPRRSKKKRADPQVGGALTSHPSLRLRYA